MVEGEGGLQGDALDTGAPARLTPCPAGGAPQEGEGQPQQHGFWLESQGLLGRRGQAIQPQKGASPDLVGPSMVGAGLTWPAESCGPVLVLGVWCWESGAWAPSSGPFIPSWAMWPPDRRNGQGASGTGRSWGGLFLGESTEPSGGGDVLFTALASWSPQTTRDSRGILLSPLGFPSGPCTRP